LSNLEQQSKKIPSLFGQQSPTRSVHPELVEHDAVSVVTDVTAFDSSIDVSSNDLGAVDGISCKVLQQNNK
jgi:hypothetical protein